MPPLLRVRPRETRYSRVILSLLRLPELLIRTQTFSELNKVRVKLCRLVAPLVPSRFVSVDLTLSIQMCLMVLKIRLLENAHKILSTVTCLVLLPRTLSTERNSVASPVEPRTSSVAPSAIIAAVMNTTLLPQSRKLKRNNHPTITDHKLPIRERLLSYTVPPPLPTVPVLRRMVHS